MLQATVDVAVVAEHPQSGSLSVIVLKMIHCGIGHPGFVVHALPLFFPVRVLLTTVVGGGEHPLLVVEVVRQPVWHVVVHDAPTVVVGVVGQALFAGGRYWIDSSSQSGAGGQVLLLKVGHGTGVTLVAVKQLHVEPLAVAKDSMNRLTDVSFWAPQFSTQALLPEAYQGQTN